MTNKKEKIGLIVIVATILTNQLTGPYVQLAIELAFSQLFLLGAYVSLISGLYISGLIVWYMWNSRERTNVPKQSKGKAGKYILTSRA